MLGYALEFAIGSMLRPNPTSFHMLLRIWAIETPQRSDVLYGIVSLFFPLVPRMNEDTWAIVDLWLGEPVSTKQIIQKGDSILHYG